MIHTPGPWLFMEDCIDNNIWADTTLIATVSKDGPFAETEKVADANARLIAAAPEMLEELRNALEFYHAHCLFIKDGNEPVNERINETERLLNKATGVKR
jgi:hypothetical protein